MAGLEDILCDDRFHLGAGNVSALSLRPDHALGLEGFYSRDLGVAGGGWGMDADPVEHLEVIRAAYVYPNFKTC
jgi:hypothetical protein